MKSDLIVEISFMFSSLEICRGAEGQGLGLEMACFDHSALVELEPEALATLYLNRPTWNAIEGDLRLFSGTPYKDIDLVPCPPYSKALHVSLLL